ncbi:MAG TPA: toll/interleukin-1 receptor domain-containing protein, partial [Aggregatilineales bacterium]|nr:toll/interleukin-1 receptor domain-containing protein [Aggregatilineales bacterium]
RLAEALKQEGFSVWIDDRINYGTEWPQVIQDSLDGCRAFAVIMSPRSYKSDWVQNELAYARGKQKSLFPLLLEGDTWVSVAATQFTDVRGGTLPPQRFFDTLERTLGSKGSPTQTLPIVTPRAVPGGSTAEPSAPSTTSQAARPQGKARLSVLAAFILIVLLGAGFLVLSNANNANKGSASDQQVTVIAGNFDALSATTTQIAANFNAEDNQTPTEVPAVPREAGVVNANDVLGYCDDKNFGEPHKTFHAGTPVTIYWVWDAKTSDEVSRAIENANYEVSVDGTLLDTWQDYRTDITHFGDGRYYVYWFVPIGKPQVGEHAIHFRVTWQQPVTDGDYHFGPGTSTEQYVSTCGFTVH